VLSRQQSEARGIQAGTEALGVVPDLRTQILPSATRWITRRPAETIVGASALEKR